MNAINVKVPYIPDSVGRRFREVAVAEGARVNRRAVVYCPHLEAVCSPTLQLGEVAAGIDGWIG